MSSNTALLIVDAQVGMLTDGDAVYQAQELLQRLGTFIDRARSAEVPVLFVQHAGPKNDLIEEGTGGWHIHPDIQPRETETVIHKRHPDLFHDTRLQEELEKLGIQKLIVAGIQTEMCVDTTCRRAYSLGYETTLVSDAHGTWQQWDDYRIADNRPS